MSTLVGRSISQRKAEKGKKRRTSREENRNKQRIVREKVNDSPEREEIHVWTCPLLPPISSPFHHPSTNNTPERFYSQSAKVITSADSCLHSFWNLSKGGANNLLLHKYNNNNTIMWSDIRQHWITDTSILCDLVIWEQLHDMIQSIQWSVVIMSIHCLPFSLHIVFSSLKPLFQTCFKPYSLTHSLESHGKLWPRLFSDVIYMFWLDITWLLN